MHLIWAIMVINLICFFLKKWFRISFEIENYPMQCKLPYQLLIFMDISPFDSTKSTMVLIPSIVALIIFISWNSIWYSGENLIQWFSRLWIINIIKLFDHNYSSKLWLHNMSVTSRILQFYFSYPIWWNSKIKIQWLSN